MRIQLSEHFTYRKLLRFTLPSVIMMVCTSIYGVVDGVFVSNFVGSDAFAAVNLIMPFLMVLGAVGFMLGTGGSALAAYTLGAGNEKRANEIFSLLIYVLIGLGAVFTIGGIAFLTPMSRLLGADETMLPATPRLARSCGKQAQKRTRQAVPAVSFFTSWGMPHYKDATNRVSSTMLVTPAAMVTYRPS